MSMTIFRFVRWFILAIASSSAIVVASVQPVLCGQTTPVPTPAVQPAQARSESDVLERKTQRAVTPVRVERPPVVDGRLDDEVWRAATPVTGFVQIRPTEGELATEATEVYLAYDSNKFYAGIRVHYSD